MKFFENVVQESFSAFPLHPCSHPNYPQKKTKVPATRHLCLDVLLHFLVRLNLTTISAKQAAVPSS